MCSERCARERCVSDGSEVLVSELLVSETTVSDVLVSDVLTASGSERLTASSPSRVFLVSNVHVHERWSAERCAREQVSDGVSDVLVSDA